MVLKLGLDEVRVIRSKLSIHVGGQEAVQALPTAAPLAGVDAGLRRRLEESERRADTLMRTNASLTSQLQDAEKERTEALVRLDAIKQLQVGIHFHLTLRDACKTVASEFYHSMNLI